MASGASDHAIGFASLQDLDRVSAALDCLEQEGKQQGRKSVVTVVGAGCVNATHAKVFHLYVPCQWHFTCIAHLVARPHSASGTAMPASRLLLNHCAGAPAYALAACKWASYAAAQRSSASLQRGATVRCPRLTRVCRYAGVELAACVQERLGGAAVVQLMSTGDRIMPVRCCNPPSKLPSIAVLPWLHSAAA